MANLPQKRLEFQTYSNREFVNNDYTVKYDHTIEALIETIKGSEMGDDVPNFGERLAAIYWSVIIPRWEILSKKDKGFFHNYEKKILKLEPMTQDDGIAILKRIGSYLYDFGVLRTESRSPDLRHILIKKLEPRRPHHGNV